MNSERHEVKVLLKTNNLSLCLNREYVKLMLSKTTCVLAFVGKHFIKIEQELTLE